MSLSERVERDLKGYSEYALLEGNTVTRPSITQAKRLARYTCSQFAAVEESAPWPFNVATTDFCCSRGSKRWSLKHGGTFRRTQNENQLALSSGPSGL